MTRGSARPQTFRPYPLGLGLPWGRRPPRGNGAEAWAEQHETPRDGRIAGGLKGDRAIPMGSQAHSAAHIGAPERSLRREACTPCDFGLSVEAMVGTWWSRASTEPGRTTLRVRAISNRQSAGVCARLLASLT